MKRVRHCLYLPVRMLIGGLLLSAGISKLFPLQAMMLTPSIEIPPGIVAVIALCEGALGWLALQGSRSKAAYYMTGMLFVVFLGALLARWSGGASSCPCLPGLEAPIVLMLAADVSCLVGLLAVRRRWLHGHSNDHVMSSLSRGLAFAIPFVLITVALYFGSLGSFLAWMSGHRVIAENHRSYLGKVIVGESKDIRFRITNFSRDPVKIVGAKTSCSCAAFKELPIDLAPGGPSDIRVTVTGRLQDSNHFTSYTARQLCDRPGGDVALRIDGAVVPSE